MKNPRLNTYALLFVSVLLTHFCAGNTFALEPNDNSGIHNSDSLYLTEFAGTGSNAEITKQAEQFYTRVNSKQVSSTIKKRTGASKESHIEGFVAGELAVHEGVDAKTKKRPLQMWGEVDHGFELKLQIRNYKELLKGYKYQKNWADKVGNSKISDLMNVKIKQTKSMIKENKRKLRKY